MDNQIFQVSGSISKIATMSRNTVRIQFDTMENASPEAMKRLFELVDRLGWMTVSVNQIEAEDILNLPEVKTDDKRTPGQRLRASLFRLWEQNNEGVKDFEAFYRMKMEVIISWIKEKLT